MFYIYILWSTKLNKRYVGSAENPSQRLIEHNSGRSRFTKGGIPWTLLYTEAYNDLTSARRQELFLKSGVGRKWLDQNLNKT